MAEQYEDRYCAFVDILGFGQLIERLHTQTDFETLQKLLGIIHQPPKADHVRDLATSDLRAQSISDAVCISTAPSAPGLAHMVYALDELSIQLLDMGFFARGAVVRGKLYHDDKMVFGEAQARAYRLEQDVVKYPRIMLATEVVSDMQKHGEHPRLGPVFESMVLQGFDGPYYLDVLRGIRATIKFSQEDEMRQRTIERANAMSFHIHRRFEESFDNPRHFEKVQWFARYFNEALPLAAPGLGLQIIMGPGTLPDPGTWGP